MSLVSLELPQASIERMIRALEKIAANSERIASFLVPEPTIPTYDLSKPHITQTDYGMIHRVEQFNQDRVSKGFAPLSFPEAVASMRNEI